MLDSTAGPANYLRTVVPHATDELAAISNGGRNYLPRALYVGGSGNVSVIAQGDSVVVVILNVASGTILPIRPKVVHTASTATDMVALY